jgi:ribose transport system substrate-binding protein
MNRSMGRAWTRRDALRASAIGGGALALGATGFGAGFARHAWAQSNDQDFDRAACYQAGEGSQPIQFDAQEGPFAVALSNSYIGNVWRTQMINMANVFVTRPDIEPMITDWQVASSGEDVAAQIAQTENMLSAGAQAIIINSISPTALTPVCQRAIDDGIPVVAFDAIVEAEGIVIVNEDQFEMGKLWAEFLIETAGESGKILMIQGVQGTSVDTDRNAGGRSVFDQYPDIEIVEVLGQWDPGTAQTVTANALAAHNDFTGVWCQGGTDGAVRAFLEAGRELVPFAGEAENGFRKQMLEFRDQGFQAISIGQSPALVAVSIRAALDLLSGIEVPSRISVPLPVVTSEDLEPGVNVFPDAPDNFFTDISIAECNVEFTYEEVAPE